MVFFDSLARMVASARCNPLLIKHADREQQADNTLPWTVGIGTWLHHFGKRVGWRCRRRSLRATSGLPHTGNSHGDAIQHNANGAIQRELDRAGGTFQITAKRAESGNGDGR